MPPQPATVTRKEKILAFVKNHRNCTKTDVTNHMDKNGASQMTTHKILKILIKDKKIISQRDKSNSQIHHLFINPKNAFNKIDKELSELENAIDIMSEPMRKMDQQRFHESYLSTPGFAELREHFEFPYRNSFGTIFLYILNYINSKIHSDEDLQILYRRVFELMIKLHRQTFVMEETQHYLSPLIHQLEKLQSLSVVEAYAKKNMIDIKPADNIVTTIRNFVRRFMSQSKSS